METVDVIVVGGGISGGLPAATYLQIEHAREVGLLPEVRIA